jgi:hypothetical protein
MALSFRSPFNDNYLECDANTLDPIKLMEIVITDPLTGKQMYVFLDLNTAISLRKHLGREIGKLRNS